MNFRKFLLAICLTILPLGAFAQETVSCQSLLNDIKVASDSVDAVELDDVTKTALRLRQELMGGFNMMRIRHDGDQYVTGIGDRQISTAEIQAVLDTARAALDVIFAAELTAKDRHDEALGPYVMAIIDHNDAVQEKTFK